MSDGVRAVGNDVGRVEGKKEEGEERRGQKEQIGNRWREGAGGRRECTERERGT